MDQRTNDETRGMYDGQCAACEVYGRVNDLCLCSDCADKLERDLVRERAWASSTLGFLLSDEDREKLRQRIVREYGKVNELIMPPKKVRHTKPTPH